MRWVVAVAAGLLTLACEPGESWSMRDVVGDAVDTLFDAYPASEAPELTARRAPRLSVTWETGQSHHPPIPDSLLEAMELRGLERLSPFPEMAQDTSIAILSIFEPRIRGDSVFMAANWLFPTEQSFFGQEYELVYLCRGSSCTRLSFRHVGTLN